MATETRNGIEYEVIEGEVFTAPVVERGSNKIYRRCVFDGSRIRLADGRPDGKGLTPDPLEARVAAIERRLDAMAAALAGD
jgi:hypothetical protein